MLTTEEFNNFLSLADEKNFDELRNLVTIKGAQNDDLDYYGIYYFDCRNKVMYFPITPTNIDTFIDFIEHNWLPNFKIIDDNDDNDEPAADIALNINDNTSYANGIPGAIVFVFLVFMVAFVVAFALSHIVFIILSIISIIALVAGIIVTIVVKRLSDHTAEISVSNTDVSNTDVINTDVKIIEIGRFEDHMAKIDKQIRLFDDDEFLKDLRSAGYEI